MGRKPPGACAMKYATAIWPDRMKATGRVNNPIKIRIPPNNSRIPAMPGRENIGNVPWSEGGKPKSFWHPWKRYMAPAIIRRRLKTLGAQIDWKVPASFMNSLHELSPLKWFGFSRLAILF